MTSPFERKTMLIAIVLTVVCCAGLLAYARPDQMGVSSQILDLDKTLLLDKARNYERQGKTDSAIIIYSTIISYTDPSKDPSHKDAEAIANAYVNLASIHYRNKSNSNKYLSYNKAYSYYDNAVRICEHHGLDRMLGSAYTGMAVLYDVLASAYGDRSFSDTTISLYYKGMRLAEKTSDLHTMNVAAMSLAACAYSKKRPVILDSVLNTYGRLRNAGKMDGKTRFSEIYCRTFRDVLNDDVDNALKNMADLRKYASDDVVKLVNAFSLHGELLHIKGRDREALSLIDSALVAARKIDDVWITLQLEEGKSNLLSTLGHTAESDSCTLIVYRLKKKILQDGSAGQIKDLHFMNRINALGMDLQKMVIERNYTRRMLLIVGCAAFVFAVMLVIIFTVYRKLKASHQHIFEEYNRHLELEKSIPVRAVAPVPESLAIPAGDDNPDGAGLRQGEESGEPARYQGRQLSEDDKQIILAKILSVLRDPEQITMPKFQIKDLSNAIGESVRSISQVINEKLGCNFGSVLAEYRIKVVCRRISESKDFRRLTTEAMAETVGIQSRSYFSTTFKKVTGLTPSEYIRQANRQDSARSAAELSSGGRIE